MNPRVKSIHIYPLKSGAGLPVDNIPLLQRGLWNDRMLMLVHQQPQADGSFRFVTQREKGASELAKFYSIPLDNGGMMFRRSDSGDAFMFEKLSSAFGAAVNVNVWKDEVKAHDMGDQVASFFTEKLGLAVRLVAFDEAFNRSVDPQFSGADDHVSFADGFPLLITNEASLDALNAQIHTDEQVGMERFRPNIVLEGLEAFEEDVILTARIGDDVIVQLDKPCSRCILTTIDQDTGEKPHKEPMQTLAKLRRGMDKDSGLKGVFFGQNANPKQLGRIHVGDKVEILARKPLHPALQQAKLKFGI
jgi:hypothetical protein